MLKNLYMKTILVDAVNAFVIKGEGVYEPMHELLEQYPNRKIVLTMAPKEKHQEFGLAGVPYELYTTGFNPVKSDPAYYKGMLEHFGLDVDEVVYFEHNPDAVESACSVGIETYHYDPERKDLEALKKFLDENL